MAINRNMANLMARAKKESGQILWDGESISHLEGNQRFLLHVESFRVDIPLQRINTSERLQKQRPALTNLSVYMYTSLSYQDISKVSHVPASMFSSK